MEDKIEIGEHVRTYEGYIAQLIHYGLTEGINGKNFLFNNPIRDISGTTYENNDFLFDDEYKKYIKKHSFNIIDLIEVGDYVNGYLIVAKRKDAIIGREKLTTEHTDYNWQGDGTLLEFYNEDIKSIVTKEQFKQVQYKVGD